MLFDGPWSQPWTTPCDERLTSGEFSDARPVDEDAASSPKLQRGECRICTGMTLSAKSRTDTERRCNAGMQVRSIVATRVIASAATRAAERTPLHQACRRE